MYRFITGRDFLSEAFPRVHSRRVVGPCSTDALGQRVTLMSASLSLPRRPLLRGRPRKLGHGLSAAVFYSKRTICFPLKPRRSAAVGEQN